MVSVQSASDLNVLLIAHTALEKVGTIQQHMDALMRSSRHRVVKVDNAAAHGVDFAAFDVLVLHYSLVITGRVFLKARLREKIAAFRGLKVLFIQDEYRWIEATAGAIRELGIAVVFSLVHPSVVRKVYCQPFLADVRFEYTLTGFVPDALVSRPVPPYEDRRLDVAYRARRLTAWYGSHTLQKWQIADAFVRDAQRFGLNVDISTREQDRIYGSAWFEFLANSKACLGTESGASVLDYTGEIQKRVEAHLAQDPGSTFEELRDLYFKEEDGRVMMNVISPRCFEAAALRTLMIMYPGEYGGILEPHKHYVLLQPDHSNIAEVVDIIRTPKLAKEIIDRTYREIAASGRWSFRALGAHFDSVLSEEGRVVRSMPVTADLVDRAKWQSAVARRTQRIKYLVAVAGWRVERAVLALADALLPVRVVDAVRVALQRLRVRVKRIVIGV